MQSKSFRFIFWSLLVSLVFSFNQAYSQDTLVDSSLLTVKRIFASRDFVPQRFGPAHWLNDGSKYVVLERSEEINNGRDIVQYDAESGKKEIMVPATKMIPSGKSEPLRIANYSFSRDEKSLLIFTNTKRVWRQNTRGDYWVLDLENWKLTKLGGDVPPSSLMFAKFSPDGKRVAYVHETNIYVENTADHTITQLTHDGSETIINGTFDWVYEEEFGLQDGFRWSPDSKSIAYWQLDASGVGVFYLINDTDSLYSKVIPIQYPKAGTTNSACRVGVVQATGGETTWMKVTGDPRNNYIARMDWVPNSKEIMFQYMNRLQNTNRLVIGNARTGETRIVFTDKDETWVDVVNDVNWLDKDKHFTWVSEMDGWRHVYIISKDKGDAQLITPGNYDIVSIESVDKKNGWLYFIASPDNPLKRYLYRIRLDGKGEMQRISPDTQNGTHRYQISNDSKWAFHTFSMMDTPPVIELVQLPKHKVKRVLVDNKKLKENVNKLKRLPTEFFRVDIGDSILLDGYQIKPPDFDSSKQYPVLFYVYGEPWGQTVWDRWGGSTYLWHLMLAQQGYIVMSIDNRGTPAPRGREWRKCVYEKIGIIASHDQAEAVKQIREWDSVDPNRIGIWGWSGGGSMTLNMMFRYPDLYQTGMAVAPVPDIRLYDTIYQERYMGLPEQNEEKYIASSPITFANQLKGNLLIVHGTGDDNVHYQGTERLINELIKQNKQFTMMAYPNRSHGIYEGENTSVHLRTLLTDYLYKNLPAGGK